MRKCVSFTPRNQPLSRDSSIFCFALTAGSTRRSRRTLATRDTSRGRHPCIPLHPPAGQCRCGSRLWQRQVPAAPLDPCFGEDGGDSLLTIGVDRSSNLISLAGATSPPTLTRDTRWRSAMRSTPRSARVCSTTRSASPPSTTLARTSGARRRCRSLSDSCTPSRPARPKTGVNRRTRGFKGGVGAGL